MPYVFLLIYIGDLDRSIGPLSQPVDRLPWNLSLGILKINLENLWQPLKAVVTFSLSTLIRHYYALLYYSSLLITSQYSILKI